MEQDVSKNLSALVASANIVLVSNQAYSTRLAGGEITKSALFLRIICMSVCMCVCVVWCQVGSNLAALKALHPQLPGRSGCSRSVASFIDSGMDLSGSDQVAVENFTAAPHQKFKGNRAEEKSRSEPGPAPVTREPWLGRTCSVGVDRATASDRTKIILGGVESRTQTPAVKPPAGLEASANAERLEAFTCRF